MSEHSLKVGDLLYDKDGEVKGKIVLVNRRKFSLWDYRVETQDGTILDLRGLELAIVDKRCQECILQPSTHIGKCVKCGDI